MDEKMKKIISDILLIDSDDIREVLESNNVLMQDIDDWLEKTSTPQVRTGLEWVDTIDDACDKRYSEEYAHGEYCHEQSFKWGFQEGVDWLERQGENSVRWNKNTDGNKPQKNHSVLMKTTHGIAEGEWKGDDSWIQYRWSSSIKDSDVLFWIELSDLG